MAFIKPSPGKYDPKDDLKSGITAVMVCSDIREIDPDPQYPLQKKNRLVFQFTVTDPRYPHLKGKKVAYICTASIYKDRVTGQESNLVKFLRQAGYVNPERGADPDLMLDKYFMVRAEMHNGKAYVQQIMPSSAPDSTGKVAPSPIDPNAEHTPLEDENIPF